MFSVIHANHIEDLRDLALSLVERDPLSPLEDDVFLVQSKGMAQWLRICIAEREGVAASLAFPLPSEFIWQAYRAVLGKSLPKRSPFDRKALVWRLMRLLPQLVDEPVFAPLATYLQRHQHVSDTTLHQRLHQLAERLADLYDQYLLYRSDWMAAWTSERTEQTAVRLDDDQRWQPVLWRMLLNDVTPEERTFHRAWVHRRFREVAAELTQRPAGIPPRLFIFGISSLPWQILEALQALSSVTDIYLLVTNPCRFYWGDIVGEREALRRETRALARARHQPHPELEALAPDELHLRANPLLSGWGAQGRDFIAALYEFETEQGFDIDHDIFLDWATEPTAPLLQQLQQDILDMAHPRERLDTGHGPRLLALDDTSVQFVSAHSPLREVEILRDQLLEAFEQDASLKPRDIVVMVPEIDRYAPLIDAVFGQYERGDERWIPFSIADRQASRSNPLLVCALQLLDLPERRLTVSELLDWLDIPAFRHRFGIDAKALPRIARWVTGSGVRWGLNEAHRTLLGLPALANNTWQFGLERMLLGYAVGGESQAAGDAFATIEPYDEIQGLDAELVGRLIDVTNTLDRFAERLAEPCTPTEWAERLAHLYDAVFAPRTAEEFDIRQRLTKAVFDWLEQCDSARFDEPIALCIVREALRDIIDDDGLAPRFLGGSVNFATLMPMRAIPFRYTWLLGMNDGDYPRTRPAQDFDLMAVYPQPGDRSRRDDDRYLMLEALLATRTRLTCSWVGQDQRGGSAHSPSILISELRDAIAQGWRLPGDEESPYEPEAGERVVDQLTQHHPLQPFSRRYLKGTDSRLYTYDEHWAHALSDARQGVTPSGAQGLPEVPLADSLLSPEGVLRLLRSPATLCLAARLSVHYQAPEVEEEDAEPFALDNLQEFDFKRRLLEGARAGEPLDDTVARMQRAGQLPLLGFGDALVQKMVPRLAVQLTRWQQVQQGLVTQERHVLRWPWQDAQGQLRSLEAVLEGVQQDEDGRLFTWQVAPAHYGEVFSRQGLPVLQKPHRLFENELKAVLASLATGQAVRPGWVFEDRILQLPPITPLAAEQQLKTWLTVMEEGWQRPLPVDRSLAFTYLDGSDPEHDDLPADDPLWQLCRDRYEEETFYGDQRRAPLRDQHLVLGELWPTFGDLLADGFAPLSRRLYGTLVARLAEAEQHL